MFATRGGVVRIHDTSGPAGEAAKTYVEQHVDEVAARVEGGGPGRVEVTDDLAEALHPGREGPRHLHADDETPVRLHAAAEVPVRCTPAARRRAPSHGGGEPVLPRWRRGAARRPPGAGRLHAAPMRRTPAAGARGAASRWWWGRWMGSPFSIRA
ncbi:hypothetical protein AB0A77_07460 [Streptomyces varsoviensis]|uniref:hypothetical protein n=1 Tax=Streptomyces varsoviensis TaxID=67373 RepID=UPI0033E92094